LINTTSATSGLPTDNRAAFSGSCSSIDLPVVNRNGASILTGPWVITSGLLDALVAVRAGVLLAGKAALGSAAVAVDGISPMKDSQVVQAIVRARQPGAGQAGIGAGVRWRWLGWTDRVSGWTQV